MYRIIDARFWNDPKVRKLSPQAKLLFLYLITNPHTHVSGIYHLPAPVIAHEIGFSRSSVDTLCHTLSEAGIVKFDRAADVVWVVKMMAYQGHGEKAERSAAFHLFEDLHNCSLTKDFLAKYPGVKRYLKPEWDTLYHTLSGAELAQDTPNPDIHTPDSYTPDSREPESRDLCCDELAKPASSPQPVLVFPCAKKEKFPLSEEKLLEYKEAFPGIDVLSECRKALQWCRDNPKKVKTVSGMPKFLGAWLGRAQDRSGGKIGTVPVKSTDERLAKILAEQAKRRAEDELARQNAAKVLFSEVKP
jgi:hypothetical protein